MGGIFPAPLVNQTNLRSGVQLSSEGRMCTLAQLLPPKQNASIKERMRDAEQLIKFFSKDSTINEIKLPDIRSIVRDIVNKSKDRGFKVTDSQYNTLNKAKSWVYRYRKSNKSSGIKNPSAVKVFTKEEIEKYQKASNV